jgi:O-methyltransferase involved in polyketide biosynthesis
VKAQVHQFGVERIRFKLALESLAQGGDARSKRLLRMFIAVRARFAEDAVTTAVARGVRQLVVLGAGLDTYAYRTTFGEGLRIFEGERAVFATLGFIARLCRFLHKIARRP